MKRKIYLLLAVLNLSVAMSGCTLINVGLVEFNQRAIIYAVCLVIGITLLLIHDKDIT